MEKPQYPYLKLTLNEKFPRLLITRRPENNTPKQKLYGALLPTGTARRMLDLLARIFRLRPCELNIQGDFDAPCPEYYLRRCLAPCVEKICDRGAYNHEVETVNLILSNRGELALERIDRKIEQLSADLEFESAAEWLAKRLAIEEIINNAKWQINASQMTEVLTLSAAQNSVEIILTTLRRGKAVGRLKFHTGDNRPEKEIIKEFIETYYRFYAPKMLFVPQDFPDRRNLEKKLTGDFGHKMKIIAQSPDKLPPSILKTINLAPHYFGYEKGQSMIDKTAMLERLKKLFGLPNPPRRIECFDVAHLAGKEIIAARVVAIDGNIRREEDLLWEFENLSETAALAAAVDERLRLLPEKKYAPDLILLDGSKQQINAVARSLNENGLPNVPVIGAVKPPKRHNQIDHFLMKDNSRIAFDRNAAEMNFLQSLRDGAHQSANKTHRELHSLVQIFNNNDGAPQVRYLLVPTRFAERGGDAEDLSPLRAMTQSGDIILKSAPKLKKS